MSLNYICSNIIVYGQKTSDQVKKLSLISSIIYAKNKQTQHFILKYVNFSKNKIFINQYTKLLDINKILYVKKTYIHCIVKDIQINIIKRNIIHIDFLHINWKKYLIVKIPLNLINIEKKKYFSYSQYSN